MIPDPRRKPATVQAQKDEQRQLAHVRDDLVREFAAVPVEVVDEQISVLVRSFQQAPVRSFVPVLVRRGAKERLRQLA